MDPELIKNIIMIIQSSNVPIANKERYFFDVYAEFADKYPAVYKMACGPKIDKQNLEFMLNMLSKIDKKELNQHDASVSVGQMLFEKYVDASVRNATS